MRRTLRPVQVTDQGKIKRVRGVAWAVRVSPSVVNRMVEVAKVTTCYLFIRAVWILGSNPIRTGLCEISQSTSSGLPWALRCAVKFCEVSLLLDYLNMIGSDLELQSHYTSFLQSH